MTHSPAVKCLSHWLLPAEPSSRAASSPYSSGHARAHASLLGERHRAGADQGQDGARDHPRLREIARDYPEVTRDYPRLREITRGQDGVRSKRPPVGHAHAPQCPRVWYVETVGGPHTLRALSELLLRSGGPTARLTPLVGRSHSREYPRVPESTSPPLVGRSVAVARARRETSRAVRSQGPRNLG